MASSWEEFIGTTAVCLACAGMGWFQHLVSSLRRYVCVIHRWVIHPNSAPNSYRKCHTINVGINVLSVSSKTGTEAELQYQNDFLMEMVQESLTASQMQITLVKTKGKHEKLLFSGWSALEAEKRKWVLSIILWDLFDLIEGPKLSNSFLACWEAVKFQQINAHVISVGI